MDPYFNPSFLYPAASAYHFAIGVTQRFSHGRLTIKLAKDGVDMIDGVVEPALGNLYSKASGRDRA